MRNHVRRFSRTSKRFKKEYRKEIRMFIIMTFGFTVAFTWRQTIFDVSQSFIKSITHIKGTGTSSLITSIFITLLSLGLIWFTSHLIKETPEEKYS